MKKNNNKNSTHLTAYDHTNVTDIGCSPMFLGFNSNSTGKCHLYLSTKHVNNIAKSTETSAFGFSHGQELFWHSSIKETCRTVNERKKLISIQTKEISRLDLLLF